MSVAGSRESWQNRSGESDGSAERPVSILLFFERPGRTASHPCGARPKDRQVLIAARAAEVQPWICPERTKKISALVQEHQAELLKDWHGYFKSGNGSRGRQAR